MGRLIVVSNRVNIPQPGVAAAGGLAVALQAALRKYHGIWFGWSGEVVETTNSSIHRIEQDGITFATIDLGVEDHDNYYNGFANRTLWPLFHYRTDLTYYDRKFDSTYFRVNALFAHALAPMIEPDDVIWVHDYHLIGCAEELRRMGFTNRMGFFLHIPFPAAEVLLTLPNHEALVRGLFGFDVVGFQTESDLRALQEYVIYEAGGFVDEDMRMTAFGRTIRGGVFPIGIDVDEVVDMAATDEAEAHRNRMLQSMAGRNLIIGVDRLDYTKGLPNRLKAFEHLLEAYPENRGKVSLLQVAPSSRMDVPEYVDIRQELESESGRINGRFAEFDWVPIRYLNKSFTRAALTGLFRASAIGLVTPLRDGMNLVAKEYVAAQAPENPGVLVLSRFAGAAHEMDAALIVNPYDTDDVVDAVQRGLNLAVEERIERWQSLMTTLRDQNVHVWRDNFVAALRDARATALGGPAPRRAPVDETV